MKAVSKCQVKTVNPVTGNKWKAEYVIVDQDLTPLLSRKAAEKMKLITTNYEFVAAVSTTLGSSTLLKDFPNIFDGKLGSLPGDNVNLALAPNSEHFGANLLILYHNLIISLTGTH